MDGWGSIPDRGKSLSFLHSVQSGPETHPNSYPVDTRGSFPACEAAGLKDVTHFRVVPRSRTVMLYFHTSKCLHDVVLNYLSTGTTLPLHRNTQVSESSLHKCARYFVEYICAIRIVHRMVYIKGKIVPVFN
jgi:hypothetical protein